AVVEAVAECPFGGAGEEFGGVGEVVEFGGELVEVESFGAVEDEEEFFVGPVEAGGVLEGVVDVVGAFGAEEDADAGGGVGGDGGGLEELLEAVPAGVMGEDVASGAEGEVFSGDWVRELF